MIHFLRHADPAVRIDAVEIDPLVVKLADEFFSVRTGENVNVIVADGLKFIAETEKQYDVITSTRSSNRRRTRTRRAYRWPCARSSSTNSCKRS
jgi:spermidine synthase